VSNLKPHVALPKPDIKERESLCPMYKVFVHNDPHTPMDFVAGVLVTVFKLEVEKALQVMMEAHKTEVALVKVETLEQAEFHIEQAHSLARGRKYPLSFSMEKA
jgi:ATP-dependent Clp protease adaptor protein ClpS